jgi:hypothetical protein
VTPAEIDARQDDLLEFVRECFWGGLMIDAADWRHNRLEYEAIYREVKAQENERGPERELRTS